MEAVGLYVAQQLLSRINQVPSLRCENGRNVRIVGNKPAAREEQLVHLCRRGLSLTLLACM